MIRNYQKNGVDINLNPIYQSISSLKNNIADLESLTSLSSLSSLSDDITNLSSSTHYISEQIELLKLNLATEVFPVILSNSSAIDSLNSQLSTLNTSFNSFTHFIEDTLIPIIDSNIYSLSSSVLNINSSISDITNSLSDVVSLSTLSGLSTLNGVFSAPYFNNQAFDTNGQLYPMTNRTLNFNSEMYYTGFFSLPMSTLNYTQAYWNLSNLKSVYVSYINAQTINDLSVYNFGFGNCKILCRTCHFDKCEFRKCTLSAWNIGKLENCKVDLSCRFEKCSDWEFSNVNFSYSSCGFASGSRIRFENVNFNSDFKCGLSNNDYIIYLHDCLINSSTFETTALTNIFTCDHSIQFIV